MRMRGVAIPFLLCVFAGCAGRGDGGPPSSGFEAKALVRAGLEAWKADQKAPLTVGGRPLRFDDEDEAAGLKLVGYEVRETPPEWSEEAGLSVTLALRDRKGRPVTRHAVYLVTRHPDLVVSRDD